MFAAVVLAFFVFSICKIEIQCSIIRRESHVTEAKASTELTKNLTLLKKIENVVMQNKFAALSQEKNKNINISIGKKKPYVNRNSRDLSTASILDQENRILISSGKNQSSKDDVGNRKPKFFGPLGLLTGPSAASLATAAAVNANALVKILNTAVPLSIATPTYFTGFYEPPHYLPFSYPVLYTVPRLANGYQNFPSGIPANRLPLPQQISNVTVGNNLHKNDTNFGKNDGANERPTTEKPKEERDATATREDVNDNTTEETELRQASSKQTTTTTAVPVVLNTTLASNVTEPAPTPTPTLSPANATGSYWPFYGYYGGSPQDFGHLILTTEDPHQRYLKDYTEDTFSPPFEKPAVFNPYQSVDSYPNSYSNSFSSGGQYPEFLNTVESDRYIYDSDNRRNFNNGFRPILK